MDYPANEWREEVKTFCNEVAMQLKPSNDTMEAVRLFRNDLPEFIEHLLTTHSAHLVARDSTFLGNIYGVPIKAETKDEALVKAINKYLQEASDALL
jgi:hypothetical protein